MRANANSSYSPKAVALSRHPSVGFVVTKPLQVMTSMNVWGQLGLPRAVLGVTPTFSDSAAVIGRLARQEVGFASVYSARSRAEAVVSLASRGVNRIYLDSDVGLKTPLAMRMARAISPKVRFSLYEEGTGLIEIPDEQRPNRLFRAMGATCAFGESRLTEEVWTYTPEAVQERLPDKPMRRIEQGLSEYVLAHRNLLMELFWPRFADDASQWRGTKCCVYLSSWEVDALAYVYLERADAFRVCKLHPHIQSELAVPTGVDQVIHAAVPAELLILELVKVFDSVEVLHHGTATEGYVRHPNVRFVHADVALAR